MSRINQTGIAIAEQTPGADVDVTTLGVPVIIHSLTITGTAAGTMIVKNGASGTVVLNVTVPANDTKHVEFPNGLLLPLGLRMTTPASCKCYGTYNNY